jgi:hypothetical protein
MSEPSGGEPAKTDAPLTLHCLGGRIAPPELVEDAGKLLALPPSARQHLWDLLPSILEDPMPREIEGAVDRFVKAHKIAGGDAARALRAARILIREASVLDVGREKLAEDLTRLSGGTSALGDLLLPGFDRAKMRIRGDIVRATLADSGKVLESIGWRIDVLSHSDRGAGLRMAVVTLTLRYRSEGKLEQISLQVLPDLLNELRNLCDRVLPRRK